MCMMRTPKAPSVAAPQLIPAARSAEAGDAADMEARLRRRRAGAAANVLTSALGIPSSAKLGEPA
ncbi:hypothetical protein SAMN05444007_108243 [Cribrihabitans marinus]|uniref:Uncharacterized protein n=1 Tax=Cribrihabitans marinus TaxID=1227549 RepID=A0A1H7CXK4_9RHOB|nr:hypothetical protein [Cribrihabitans marinus]GGH36266.1 hypothetical protein GCM10010973_30130 [Cribrihabitans marinus]SEJ91470.1 hypothetical protein SAMN05444007_108243 [Cribrihabitans marinus]